MWVVTKLPQEHTMEVRHHERILESVFRLTARASDMLGDETIQCFYESV